ncbi:hypothetical protein M378DRAFT_333543 [Amanita muscaria Koide BX008]|uniref:ATP-dependent RNA helicase n=1 Tax=Amanita muscaria (strain Koide BX008) TaxID=946122 RepID=A0A0C2SW42_AMAMK|nr:hypothetical protein M378DRAFT_333543 [Amanita muscaria Koide BX008]
MQRPGYQSQTLHMSTGGSRDVTDRPESNWDRIVDKFDDMGLKQELLHGIYAYGVGSPLTIQQRAIVPIIKGHDVIVTAPPGAGKSATCIIPILQRLNTSSKAAQALIVTDSRQVAAQIQNDVAVFGNYNVECYACVGTTNIHEDIAKLQGVQVVVGTPGRVCDLINRQALRTDNIKIVCLYDAKILLHGSRDQVVNVFRLLQQGTQAVLLSSVAMPTDMLEVVKKLMPKSSPRFVTMANKMTLKDVKQFYIPIEKEGWKLDALCNLRDMMITNQAVVYCNSKQGTEQLATAMRDRGIAVSAIHERTERRQCAASIRGFLSGVSRILILTDYLAPSVDGHQVSVIINYDLPRAKEYIERMGNDGGLGDKRLAINFVTKKEIDRLREIERFYKTKIGEMPHNLPDNVANFIEGIQDQSPEPLIENSTKTPRESTASTRDPRSYTVEREGSRMSHTGDTAQSESTMLATVQAENISLQTRIDWLTDRINEEGRRANQAQRRADQARNQLELLRLEDGYHTEQYTSLHPVLEEGSSSLPHKKTTQKL